MVGAEVTNQLDAAGFEVVGLDIADGHNVNDAGSVNRHIEGCSHVVHLAALTDEPDEPDLLLTESTGDCEHVMRKNVGGTSLLLGAAGRAGVERFVFLSKVSVPGCFMSRGTPRYLPIDDHHVDPHGPYAWSERSGEELCATFTRTTGTATIYLRAPGVINETNSAFICQARESNPESEWSPFWEYGAFIDVRDLAAAITVALAVRVLTGHHRLFVNADDISSSTENGPTLAGRLLPAVAFTKARVSIATSSQHSSTHPVLESYWIARRNTDGGR